MLGDKEDLDANKAPDGGIEDSSTTTNQEADANAGVSMLDFVKKTVSAEADETVDDAKHKETQAEEPSTEETHENETPEEEEERLARKKKESDSKNESDGKEKEGSEEEKEASTEEEDKGEKQEPVPYARFQEVNEKFRKAETDLENSKPIVEHHTQIVDYCSKNNISQQQFREGLETMALINTNPKEALVRLNRLVEDLQGFTGDKLPKDLQDRVDNGKLELQDAKELAQARAQARYGERSLKQYQAMQVQAQQTELQRSMIGAVNSWVDSKKTDPDFKPKAKVDAPDGKWERVYDKASALLNQLGVDGKPINKVETPQQLAALFERAYQAVSLSMGSPKGKPATRKVLSHNGSSRTNGNKTIEGAKTMREAIEIGLSQR